MKVEISHGTFKQKKEAGANPFVRFAPASLLHLESSQSESNRHFCLTMATFYH